MASLEKNSFQARNFFPLVRSFFGPDSYSQPLKSTSAAKRTLTHHLSPGKNREQTPPPPTFVPFTLRWAFRHPAIEGWNCPGRGRDFPSADSPEHNFTLLHIAHNGGGTKKPSKKKANEILVPSFPSPSAVAEEERTTIPVCSNRGGGGGV